jgi:hypothetical protein
MHPLLEAFEERLAEVNTYIDFLEVLDAQTQKSGAPKIQGAKKAITAEQQRILYSSVYLHLYNLVESTMTRCVEAVSSAAHEGKWKAKDLSPPIRKEWVRFKAKTHKDLSFDTRLTTVFQLLDELLESSSISEFQFERGGGGNWDDDAINEICLRLGFEISNSKKVYSAIKKPMRNDAKALVLVKYFRNNLAHGKISFSQCAQDWTVPELKHLAEITANYLYEVVQRFVEFISKFEFINSGSRPSPASALL